MHKIIRKAVLEKVQRGGLTIFPGPGDAQGLSSGRQWLRIGGTGCPQLRDHINTNGSSGWDGNMFELALHGHRVTYTTGLFPPQDHSATGSPLLSDHFRHQVISTTGSFPTNGSPPPPGHFCDRVTHLHHWIIATTKSSPPLCHLRHQLNAINAIKT
uniref:Uncharacterized protein n=1 Tax=Romanomermis culicivorax TaxID=13658 RepID=A0A915JCI5_ROMCU